MRIMRSVALLCLGLVAGVLAAHWLEAPQPAALMSWARDMLPAGQATDVQARPDKAAGEGGREILYYRHPMGLPETSQEPKKDSMGMDYIPIYAGEVADDSGAVTISTERIQRSGVRTEKAERRTVSRPIMIPGSVAVDESRVQIVTLRAEGFIEELFVDRTGQAVKAGDPLFRVYMPQLQAAQVDLHLATKGAGGPRERLLGGASQKLRNLGVPDSFIKRAAETGENIRTIDWPAPMDGVVLAKRVIDGQRVMPGEELYRIGDLSRVWVIADLPERELAHVAVGDPVEVTIRSFSEAPHKGKIDFIYPELRPETRTARIRIELPNEDGSLRADMYADVAIAPGSKPVIAVPESAILHSGQRKVVLVAKGGGRFEPREVTLGRRGENYVEIVEGVAEGEEIVTTATFLIDAESNLKAALTQFTAPEPQQ